MNLDKCLGCGDKNTISKGVCQRCHDAHTAGFEEMIGLVELQRESDVILTERNIRAQTERCGDAV